VVLIEWANASAADTAWPLEIRLEQTADDARRIVCSFLSFRAGCKTAADCQSAFT